MKKKIIIALVALLVVGGGAYKVKFAKAEPEPKVHGHVYVLPKEFTVNLDAGRFAKLGVGLVLDHDYVPAAAGGHGATPPEGYGADPQEALVRDIITDKLTDISSEELTGEKGRHHLKEEIAKKINKTTDIKVEHVIFTDIAVQ